MANHTTRRHSDPLQLWAHSLPKVELHRHLEGALRLSTLAELAPACGLPLPANDPEALRPMVQMTEDAPDFQRFLDKFQVLRRFYISRDVIQRMTREAIADAAQDNIVYLELRFNPLALARLRSYAFRDVVAWVMEAAAEGERETGTRTCLILQIPRAESLAVADEIVDLAIANAGPQVRGIDLAGDEVAYPPQRFAAQYERARAAGLNATVHAGEAVGPASVENALRHLHPARIGHGVRSIEDSRVVALVKERGAILEVCPTSNLHTGVVRDFAQHPLVDLVNLGLKVTLNTDDPSVSDTTLTDEIVVAVRHIGLAQRQVYHMLRHAVDAGFLPEGERADLHRRVRGELERFSGAAAAYDEAGSPPATSSL